MSDRDELDRLADELFRSARGERAPAGAKASVLAAVLQASERSRERSAAPKRAGTSMAWVWPAGAAAVALAAGFALLIGSDLFRDEPVSVAPEHALDEPVAREAKPIGSETVAIPAPLPATSASGTPSVSARQKQARPLTLSEEVAALDQVRTLLQARNASGALELLDGYERRPGVRMRDEATLLRLEALAGGGRAAEAAELAARFVASNPGSTLADKARTYLKPETPEGDEP